MGRQGNIQHRQRTPLPRRHLNRLGVNRLPGVEPNMPLANGHDVKGPGQEAAFKNLGRVEGSQPGKGQAPGPQAQGRLTPALRHRAGCLKVKVGRLQCIHMEHFPAVCESETRSELMSSPLMTPARNTDVCRQP